MKFLLPALVYLFFGALYYAWIGTLEIQRGRMTRGQGLVVSLFFWPIALMLVKQWLQYGDRDSYGYRDRFSPRGNRSSGNHTERVTEETLLPGDIDKPLTPSAPPAHPDYNEAAFPPEETSQEDAADAPAAPEENTPTPEAAVVDGQQELADALKAREFDYGAGAGFEALSAFDGEEAPLTEELTVTWRPTGVSKTYPAGTPFPSTLRKDWENGFFTSKT